MYSIHSKLATCTLCTFHKVVQSIHTQKFRLQTIQTAAQPIQIIAVHLDCVRGVLRTVVHKLLFAACHRPRELIVLCVLDQLI